MSEDFNKNNENNSPIVGKSIEKTASQITEESNFAPANFIPLILIFVIFYFFIIRPQSKKHRQHQETINSLKVGEVVVTTSGIIGKIKSNPDKNSFFDLEIADNLIIKIAKNHIAEVFVDKNKIEKSSKTEKNKKLLKK
ncbi:MAG: preprotein translocase subunit YajC [Rickettsiales bacterium]|nr:preprotein translocase subunit YajC [Rickettsiales bacterium]